MQIAERSRSRTSTRAWAAILVASVLGIAFYGAVALAERLRLSWHPSDRGREE